MITALNNYIYPNKFNKYTSFISIFSILLGLIATLTFYKITYLKAVFLLMGAFGVGVIFLLPEFGLVLSFSSAIFKEWLSLNVPIFAQLDFSIAIFGITFLGIIYSILKKGISFDRLLENNFVSLLLFTVLLIISTLYTSSSEYGNNKAMSFVIFNWSLFLFPILYVTDEKVAFRIVYIFALLGVVVSIFTIVSIIKSFLNQTLIFTYRASFLEVNPISFAGWIGVINILLISIFPKIQTKHWKFFAGFAIFLLSVAIIVANSRGPLFSFIATLSVIMFFKLKKLTLKKILIFGLLLIVFLIIVFSFLPEQLTSRYTTVIKGEAATRQIAYYTINTRLDFWNASIESATKNVKNFFIGIGSGGFSKMFYHRDSRDYPHNIFFEILVELGVIGLLLIVWHFSTILFKSVTCFSNSLSESQKTLMFAFSMAALFNLIAAQFSGDLNDNRRLWFFLGFICALSNFISLKKYSKIET